MKKNVRFFISSLQTQDVKTLWRLRGSFKGSAMVGCNCWRSAKWHHGKDGATFTFDNSKVCISSPSSDINECMMGSHGCNQTCSNTVGSFKCGCHPGYRLARDNKSCEGQCRYEPCTVLHTFAPTSKMVEIPKIGWDLCKTCKAHWQLPYWCFDRIKVKVGTTVHSKINSNGVLHIWMITHLGLSLKDLTFFLYVMPRAEHTYWTA